VSTRPIPVTQPFMPPLEEFIPHLARIWESKWLTNGGQYHQQLEKGLSEYLGVEHLSLFSNGTIALIVALQCLRITGEVITTPYSFVATAHSLMWNNIKPVFVDIDPASFNMDPDKIEAAITAETTAIMPVHCYGNPCDVDRIQKIADAYGLRVIYDAAHAFAVRHNGQPVLSYGDMSALSFHATKVFNTFEGGALVCPNRKTKLRIDSLKNFGFSDDVTVVAPGINGKMNEIQAAFGLLQLKHIDEAIAIRRSVDMRYRLTLAGTTGLTVPKAGLNATQNYSYFPILVDDAFPLSRDELYQKLNAHGILSRRYFYPLISNFPLYRSLASSNEENLPVATDIASRVLCLPIHTGLEDSDVDSIVKIITG
jgi:dTDP-4-amino-4,6-dideoxygalactose transaminase